MQGGSGCRSRVSRPGDSTVGAAAIGSPCQGSCRQRRLRGSRGRVSRPAVRAPGAVDLILHKTIPRPVNGPGRADMRAFRPLVRPLHDRPLRRPIAYDRFFGPHRPENFANAKPGHYAIPGRFHIVGATCGRPCWQVRRAITDRPYVIAPQMRIDRI